MLTYVFYTLVSVTLISVAFAIKGDHQARLYWIAALTSYVLSFLGGFSVGQITVGFTFVFVMLAIAHSFNWVKNGLYYAGFLMLGLVIGGIMVFFVDDYWLFFPFAIFG
ncbi:hypothetical protein [Virgibacillus doumboii]|uniref:hypothetical protein n=1 Tax=Virgibacillus doumboii TaxID=2697503 RepID=UPI0013DF1DDA|nr:hypothetical protein [Virgibacillus doumboii]